MGGRALEHLKETQILADGVRESNKGKRTFVIVSLRIRNCIYPYKIFNPLIGVPESKPSPVDVMRYLNKMHQNCIHLTFTISHRDLVDEINVDKDFKVTAFIGDMVERHYIKGLVSVNGQYGCEVCKATSHGRQKWPYPETTGKALRTSEGMRQISR